MWIYRQMEFIAYRIALMNFRRSRFSDENLFLLKKNANKQKAMRKIEFGTISTSTRKSSSMIIFSWISIAISVFLDTGFYVLAHIMRRRIWMRCSEEYFEHSNDKFSPDLFSSQFSIEIIPIRFNSVGNSPKFPSICDAALRSASGTHIGNICVLCIISLNLKIKHIFHVSFHLSSLMWCLQFVTSSIKEIKNMFPLPQHMKMFAEHANQTFSRIWVCLRASWFSIDWWSI